MSCAKAFILRCIAEAKRLDAELADEEADAIEARERTWAFRAAWALYDGKKYARANALANDLSAYASNGWPRERDMPRLPPSASERRRAWHRFLKSRDGVALGWRQILNIAESLQCAGSTLQTPSCESGSTLQLE